MKRVSLIGLFLSCVYLSCTMVALPRPTTSQYFVTTGGAFTMNLEANTTQYFVTLKVLNPIKSGYSVVASFQNPAGAPLKKSIVATGTENTISFDSPPITGLQHATVYYVTIEIVSDDGRVISKHVQGILYQKINLSKYR